MVSGMIMPTAITTPGIEYPKVNIFKEDLIYKLSVDRLMYEE